LPSGLPQKIAPSRIAAEVDSRQSQGGRVSARRGKDSEALLKEIAGLLRDGLKTEVEPFPETEKEFAAVLDRLRALPPDDIKGRLVIAGFVDHPFGPDQQRCQECIYYLVHRKWCDIPEISLPAEPDWWCRLWRI
jgi:hypothetical protein